MHRPTDISVIIPTLATWERRSGLSRAIESSVSQAGVRAIPIVIANGEHVHLDVIEDLRRRSDIRLSRRAEASLPKALKQGRSLVDTEYFTVLDDDDELLPGALETRLRTLRADPAADTVITRGKFREMWTDVASSNSLDYARFDPLISILRDNWFSTGSALFRSQTIDEEFFEDLPAYLEWTYLGILIALRRKIAFIDDLTFIHNLDNPTSISKTRAYNLEKPMALRRLLQLELPPAARKLVMRKMAAAFHACSEIARTDHDFVMAWKYHLQSFRVLYGLKYISYTRHLVTSFNDQSK